MHNKMPVVEAKDWSKMQAYFEWNKSLYAPALEAMKQYQDIDFEKMYMEDTSLFVFFVSIYSEKEPKFNQADFWNLHYSAYQKLKADGILNFSIHDQKVQMIQGFLDKVNGPCLISKDELEDTMTIKNKKNVTTVHFDYHEILDLIEELYDIEVRGFFDKLKTDNIKTIFGRYFQDYESVQRLTPVASLEANYLRIISDVIDEQIEYIDFWHHMLDYDFSEISNGSISTMWEPEDEVSLMDTMDNKKEFQKAFSTTVKKVFFKELSQIKEVNSEDDSGIDFLISW